MMTTSAGRAATPSRSGTRGCTAADVEEPEDDEANDGGRGVDPDDEAFLRVLLDQLEFCWSIDVVSALSTALAEFLYPKNPARD